MLESSGFPSAAFRLPERVAAVTGGVRDISKGSMTNSCVVENTREDMRK